MIGEDISLDRLLDNIYERRDIQNSKISSYVCLGTSVYEEYLSSGELEKTIHMTRRLYTKTGFQDHDEYLEMSLNGKLLIRSEMTEQIDEWNRRGKKRGTTNMPLQR